MYGRRLGNHIPRRAKARPGSHLPPGQMNKTEARFAELLEQRRMTGEVRAWWFEPFKLRLGVDWKHTLTVDFVVQLPDDTLELIDVKGGGGWEEDARCKIKSAAAQFPMFAFVGYTQKRKGGPWIREEFSP